jgi:hypothetical protein
MFGAIPPLPNTPSWHGAQLKKSTGTALPFTFTLIWNSSGGKTYTHIDHIFVDEREHSLIFYVGYFIGADYDTDHYLVVGKVAKRHLVSYRSLLWKDLI